MNGNTRRHQMLREPVPHALVTAFVRLFGLESLNDTRPFTATCIEHYNTIVRFGHEIVPQLLPYYVPCKAAKYLHADPMTWKKIITVLRQVCRPYGYRVVSREKYSHGNKFLLYQLLSTTDKSVIIDASGCTLHFT